RFLQLSMTPPPCAVGRTKARVRTLRQVVAERSEEHVLYSAPPSPAGTGPDITDHIGILRPPLHRALRTFVEAVPESESALDNHSRRTRAVRQCARSESITSGRRFGRAT